MLCANINNGEINLVKENQVSQLATYNELIDELCLGNLEIGNMTLTKDGVIICDEEESEMDFVRFRC